MLKISIFVTQRGIKTRWHILWKPRDDGDDGNDTKQSRVTSDTEMAQSLWMQEKTQACTLRCEYCVHECLPGSFSACIWEEAALCDSVWLGINADSNLYITVSTQNLTVSASFQRFMPPAFQRGRSITCTMSSECWQQHGYDANVQLQ